MKGSVSVSHEKTKIIVVVGPTASGKTALAVHLAKKYKAQVISADSMQIYKDMNIATAKPTIEEMQGITHHMIDFLEPDKKYSVADYVGAVREKIEEISRCEYNNNIIVAGGTGLYINSLIDNIVFDDTDEDPAIRQELFDIAEQMGSSFLHNMLAEIDKDSAIAIHQNNIPRVVRAIEYFKKTNKLFSVSQKESASAPSPYDCLEIGINYENRATLYERIDRRVDIMVEQGLLEEAKNILQKENLLTSATAIGYKELIPYVNDEKTLEQCLDNLKQNSRRYAKRQLTWFRKRKNIHWFYADKFEHMDKMYGQVEKLCDDFYKL